MTLWEKESKTPSLRPRGVPSLSANHHYHHDHSPHPWWREGPLVGTSGLRLQTQVLKVVDALRCRCTGVQSAKNYRFKGFHKNQKETENQSKSFLTGASTSSIGLKSSRGVLLSKSESRHCVQKGNVLIDTLVGRYNADRNDLLPVV